MSNVKGVKLEEKIFIKSDGNFHSRLQNMDNTEMENRKCKILIYSNSSAFLWRPSWICVKRLFEFWKHGILYIRNSIYILIYGFTFYILLHLLHVCTKTWTASGDLGHFGVGVFKWSDTQKLPLDFLETSIFCLGRPHPYRKTLSPCPTIYV